ncbi:MAG: glycosyltransferase [Actinomycetota bacterium]|nr:glycosyltransferase [Actinomycetota bacterium]
MSLPLQKGAGTGVKVLCSCLPGSGHFLPMLPLAQALADAGHDVRFATAADFCPSIAKRGFGTFSAGMSLAQQLEEAGQRYPEAQLAPGKQRFETFVPQMLAGVAAPSRAEDVVSVIGEWRPDVVVHDETEFGAPVAAAKFGIPYADQSVGILRPLAMARLAGQVLAPLWRKYDVDLGSYGGLFRYLYLDVCPPSLQSKEIDQVGVAHRAHNLSAGTAADGATPEWIGALPKRPTVYVSLGTIFNRDKSVFAAILEGLRDEQLNVIVTVGNNNDPADLGPQPGHVHVERFIPQALILPHCDVVINQGGTAILDILGHGLPVLVLPQGANQFHNAEACVTSGVGRALMPDQVTADAVRRELSTVLEEPSYRARAQAIRREFASMPGPATGVELVERLAAERVALPNTASVQGPVPRP